MSVLEAIVSEVYGSTVMKNTQPLRDPKPDACNFSRFLRVVVKLLGGA